jgi:hypothetical protein
MIGTGVVLAAIALLLLVNAGVGAERATIADARTGSLVATLGLTDLALFTEASYTRHPSLTDLNTPFQDSPLSFEHFPTGSLMQPPASLVHPHVAKY